MVPDGVCQTVRVQHSGKIQERVTEGAFEVLEGLARVVDHRDAMRALTLNEGEQAALANAALMLRYEPDPERPNAAAPITSTQLNRPRRQDDRAPDLWTTFNRIQENIVKGGLRSVSANGARTSTRAIVGIDQGVRLNRALWSLAEEMKRLKSAT